MPDCWALTVLTPTNAMNMSIEIGLRIGFHSLRALKKTEERPGAATTPRLELWVVPDCASYNVNKISLLPRPQSLNVKVRFRLAKPSLSAIWSRHSEKTLPD